LRGLCYFKLSTPKDLYYVRIMSDKALPSGSTDPSSLGGLTEQMMRDSVAFVRRIGDAMPGFLWTATPDGALDYASQLWLDYAGTTLEAMLGGGWRKSIHPDDAQRAGLALAAARASGSPLNTEFRLRAHDGTYRWFLISGRVFRNNAGKVTRWVGVNVDIDDQKRAEAELRRLNETLEQRVEQRTLERDRIWRLSKDILVVASGAGYFLNSNPCFTALMGWSEQEMRLFPFTDLAHPDQREALAEQLRLLVAGEPVVRQEIRTRHKDGGYRWLSWTITAEAGMLYMVGRDVTTEREQAEALRQAEAALRQSQKMEAVGHLTGGLAHDFNNLLAGISGSLEMMRARIRQGRATELDRFLDAAAASATRAASLTHRLLAFSRRQTLEPRPVDPNRLVLSMEELIRRTVGPSILVETIRAASAWWTLCDPGQLESALLNLAINARDAMPDGGTLTIETANARLDHHYAAAEPDVAPGDYVAISVTDTGTGMAPEVVARAFDPFFTTKPLGAGTGLGLSMIYGFVRQSDGHVRIISEPGQGSTIRLYLPRDRTAEGWAAGGATDGAADPMVGLEIGETVLVVDDEPVVRMLVSEVVSDLGYAAIEAADGQQAVAELQSAPRLDLLITDIGLPGGMNGRQVADAARRLRPDLAVLFITGYAEAAVIGGDQLDPGMQIMTKPFSLSALKDRIRGMARASHQSPVVSH
jgi:PAS domain S-box-containing protein